jgi:hypothetical protein
MSAKEQDSEEMVAVAKFYDSSEAHMAKCALEAAGIDCFLAGENANQLLPTLSTRLMVRRSDEDAARGLLEQAEEDTGGDVETGDGDGK